MSQQRRPQQRRPQQERPQQQRRPQQNHRSSKKVKSKNKVNPFVKILIFLFILIFIFSIASLLFIFQIDSKLDKQDINKNNLGINNVSDKKITNIVLFGLDRRNPEEKSRSDVIMIISVDRKNNKIKTSSLLRDSAVNIEGHEGLDKLNHAFAYGGPELAIKTINQNFNMDIEDYIALDFDSMAKVIDVVGSITIDVKENEIKNANKNISEYARVFGISNPTYIEKTGLQELNGMQACGYSRVRYDGTGDDRYRTDRQRLVAGQAFKKLKDTSIFKLPGVANELAPIVETSMDATEAVFLAASALVGKKSEYEEMRFPMDSDLKFQRVGNTSMAVFDKNITVQKLHGFIYDDIIPE